MGMILWKVMTKTKPHVAHIIFEIVDGGWWVTSRSQVISSIVWQIWFRHNFSKKLSPGSKNSLERRAIRFPTICAKNQALKFWWSYDKYRFSMLLPSKTPRRRTCQNIRIPRFFTWLHGAYQIACNMSRPRACESHQKTKFLRTSIRFLFRGPDVWCIITNECFWYF
jgi:hypothetical protein